MYLVCTDYTLTAKHWIQTNIQSKLSDEKKCIDIPLGLISTSNWLYCPNTLCTGSEIDSTMTFCTQKSLSFFPFFLHPSMTLFNTLMSVSYSLFAVVKDQTSVNSHVRTCITMHGFFFFPHTQSYSTEQFLNIRSALPFNIFSNLLFEYVSCASQLHCISPIQQVWYSYWMD